MSSMDRSLCYGSPSSSSSGLSSPSPRPNKVVMQREYRSREGECFNTLRDIIHKLTGEAFQTRHEILTKAIELLLTSTKLKETGVGRLTSPYGVRSPIDFNDATLDHIEYSMQPSLPSQIWHAPIEPDSQTTYYPPQFLGQEYSVVPGTNPALNGRGWFHQ